MSLASASELGEWGEGYVRIAPRAHTAIVTVTPPSSRGLGSGVPKPATPMLPR
jgi:hypothetical protein